MLSENVTDQTWSNRKKALRREQIFPSTNLCSVEQFNNTLVRIPPKLQL